MVKINEQQYLEAKGTKTSFFVKHSANINKQAGEVYLGTVSVPKELVGKRLRFKVELVED